MAGSPPKVAFARRLRLHAATEEQALYPATIIIGRYIEERLHEDGNRPLRYRHEYADRRGPASADR